MRGRSPSWGAMRGCQPIRIEADLPAAVAGLLGLIDG